MIFNREQPQKLLPTVFGLCEAEPSTQQIGLTEPDYKNATAQKSTTGMSPFDKTTLAFLRTACFLCRSTYFGCVSTGIVGNRSATSSGNASVAGLS